MHLSFPFGMTRGAVDSANSHDAYVEQLIEQVLFTIPGERVDRPDFGCGIQKVLFKPDNSELIAATLFIVRGQLDLQLDGIIRVEHAEAAASGGELHVLIRYMDVATAQRRTARFSR